MGSEAEPRTPEEIKILLRTQLGLSSEPDLEAMRGTIAAIPQLSPPLFQNYIQVIKQALGEDHWREFSFELFLLGPQEFGRMGLDYLDFWEATDECLDSCPLIWQPEEVLTWGEELVSVYEENEVFQQPGTVAILTSLHQRIIWLVARDQAIAWWEASPQRREGPFFDSLMARAEKLVAFSPDWLLFIATGKSIENWEDQSLVWGLASQSGALRYVSEKTILSRIEKAILEGNSTQRTEIVANFLAASEKEWPTVHTLGLTSAAVRLVRDYPDYFVEDHLSLIDFFLEVSRRPTENGDPSIYWAAALVGVLAEMAAASQDFDSGMVIIYQAGGQSASLNLAPRIPSEKRDALMSVALAKYHQRKLPGIVNAFETLSLLGLVFGLKEDFDACLPEGEDEEDLREAFRQAAAVNTFLSGLSGGSPPQVC